MDIQKIPIEQINPAPYNPRIDLKPDDPEYQKLRRSIDEFGCVEPLIWNIRTNNLVSGHQRFKVLLARGDQEVIISVVDLPPDKEKALNIALNKIGGDWDRDKLSELLAELIDVPDIDVELTGFDLPEIEELVAGFHGGEEEADAAVSVDPDAVPITQPGDLIELGVNGQHRLLCGDATKQADAARLFGEQRASLCHMDPPYGVNYDPRNRPMPPGGGGDSGGGAQGRVVRPIRNDDLTPKRYAGWFAKVLAVIVECLIPGGGFYIWNSHRQFGLMHDLLTACGMKVRSTIVWAKESFSPGFGDYNEQVEFCLYGHKGGARHRWYGPKNASTLWKVHRDRTQDYHHPTQKPLELAERAIRHGSKRGEIIYDPFLGSGTTLIAAARLGRHCFGMEIEPCYCDVIVRRYIALAGEQAVSPDVLERYRLPVAGATSGSNPGAGAEVSA